MRTALVNSLHNPFQNRFNVPVTRRCDEMQAEAYAAWLLERNNAFVAPAKLNVTTFSGPAHSQRLLAEVIALLLGIVSTAIFFKIF